MRGQRMKLRRVSVHLALPILAGLLACASAVTPALAQPAPGAPPAVGVVKAERRAVTES